MLEKEIQARIKKLLESKGFKVLRPINVSKSGYPDLWVLKSGKLFFIEVKRPGENLTRLQEYRKKELEGEGFEVHVIREVNELNQFI